MARWLAAGLVYAAVLACLTRGLIRSLREQRVAHRFYLFEKDRKIEYATRRLQPGQYWFSITVQFLLWALVCWSGIKQMVR